MNKDKYKKVSSIYRESFNRDFLDCDYFDLVEQANIDFSSNMKNEFGSNYFNDYEIKKAVKLMIDNKKQFSNFLEVDRVREVIKGIKNKSMSINTGFKCLYFLECSITRRTFLALKAFLNNQMVKQSNIN